MELIRAIREENLESIKDIIALTPEAMDGVDENDLPIIFVAAKNGNIDIVKYMVEYSKVSMNMVDSKGRNILHFAALSGNVELVKYFVERIGMSPVEGDKNLETPYDIAVDKGYEDIKNYFADVCGTSIENMYRNPIRTGMYPDPSIVRVGDDYYMVNSSFVFFPCVPISHSKDLVHWKTIGHAITNPDWAYLDELEGGRGYWAPDISYHNGRFYITITYRLNDDGKVKRKQIITSSDKPEGPYNKPVFIDEDGIDPSLFVDDDGRRYMLLNRGARILELNEEATKQISEAKMLYYGDNKRNPEGPHLLKKDGYYYLFLAEGGTGMGHRISVARSKELFGIYETCPYNPIMRQFNEEGAIQRCGHGKPVQTQNGEWYMVYLCGRLAEDKYTILGRETALDPITWTPDGWPIVNSLKGPSTLQKKPNLPNYPAEELGKDDFDSEGLNSMWVFPRPPQKDAYYISDSKLYIKGSPAPFEEVSARNIVLRRQTAFDFNAETKFTVPELKVGQYVGLTCYYDENTWLVWGVFKGDKGCLLQIREHVGIDTYDSEIFAEVNTGDELTLLVDTKGLKRAFSYAVGEEEAKEVINLENVYYISDEGCKIGKRFTGAMVGMGVYSGKDELYVGFEYFDYKPKNKY